jgi:hypothetical protein
MENVTADWSNEELKVYLLIYSANADLSESKIEVDFIKSKIKTSNFEKIHAEFDEDNDYQSIQKIHASMREHGYSDAEKERLFAEIKELFLADGEYDILEQNLYRGLTHILL